jgi:hypothetical protein
MVKKTRSNKSQLNGAGELLGISANNDNSEPRPDCADMTLEPTPHDNSDIVCDILACIQSRAAIDSSVLQEIDKEVRHRWGGDRVWISKKPGAGMSFRNEAIKRDYWQRGERISLLARRYQISTRRIWEILKS